MEKYCIGIDYGTDSVRALLVNESGKELASSVYEYPRWKKGMYCDAASNRFRQHPLDYIEGLKYTVKDVLKKVPGSSAKVVALGIDTTGSTPVAVDEQGTPLGLLPEFSDNPNALFILWKDHTAIAEADEINELSKNWKGPDYTKYSGGFYSSEWFWSKILHVIREDEKIREAAFSWVEHCDWIPALLSGETDPLKIKRSRCAAGHKAMWHREWNGLPSDEFLSALDPLLKGLRGHLYSETWTSDIVAGHLCKEWAKELGLNESTVVSVGALDAHMGAVGAAIEPYFLCKVIGTSTCDMLVVPEEAFGDKLVPGISGQVDGSIVPGMIGLEAGQSAFGDIYNWFRNLMLWPLENFSGDKSIQVEMKQQILAELSRKAAQMSSNHSDILALDWMNGRRTPDMNHRLKGVLAGLTLASDPPAIFRALVESTAFGAKKITDRYLEQQIQILGIIALGGVAKKNSFVMQVLADVLNMPIKVVRSEHTCALGAAMCAAVTAGIYSSVELAQEKMGSGFETTYEPIPANVQNYNVLYAKYSEAGRFFESYYQ